MKKFYSLVFMILMTGSLSAQRFHNQKIIGYVPSYSDASNVDYSNLTHAFFCFVNPYADGSIKAMYSYEKVRLNTYLTETQKYGTKRIVTVGNEVGVVAKDANAIQKYADTMVKYCKHHGFDGLDIDWEMLSTTEESDRYAQLFDTLSKRLHAEGLVLVATLPATDYWGQWFPDKALQKADWLQVMAYAFTGWTGGPFGNHAGYDDFVASGQYWEKDRGYSKDKIVIGVPFYGVKFGSTSGGQAITYSYKEIVAQFPDMPESADQTPGDDYDFFNGPATMRKKSQYLIDNKFGGIMIWEVTQDVEGDGSLLKQIACTYNDSPCRIGTSINNVNANLEIKIWSQNHELLIDSPNNDSYVFQFYDMLGRVIYETNEIHVSTGSSRIQVSNQVSGNVLCRVMSKGKTYSKMIHFE